MNLQAADTVILFDTDWNPQATKFLSYDFLNKWYAFVNNVIFVDLFSG